MPKGLNSIRPTLAFSFAPVLHTKSLSTSRNARNSTCPCLSELSLPKTFAT